MKKLITLSVSALAALATMTGCNDIIPKGDPGPTVPDNVIASTEEQSVNGTTITEYIYNKSWQQTGQKQTLNAKLVYEDSDISISSYSDTRYRTIHNEDGTTVRRKLATTYGYYGDNYTTVKNITKYEVFAEDNTSVPIERIVNEYDSYGNLTNNKHEMDGKVVSEQYNFQYMPSSGYTYTQREGDTVAEMLYVSKPDNGYEIYTYPAGSKSDSDRIIVKKLTDFSENYTTLTRSYVITNYDAEGKNGVETTVTSRYQAVTTPR
ncbi:MAG: hypothetical protein LBV38_04155 [Alistipes sp.]|nr:hypothetical protein [Alistipes sp.]